MINIFFISSFYLIASIFILISILGYGKLFNKFILIDNSIKNFKNYFFICGLIFIGFISIIVNFIIPINDYYSILIVGIGILFYIYFFYINSNKQTEILFIFIVIFISYIFSFFAGTNDDYLYHFNTIKNYKSLILSEIEHHRMISYNSHWLFLNSIFTLNIFNPSLFILSSLIYSISIYDFYNMSKLEIKKGFYISGLYIYFSLIFLLGVLNTYKDFGTDVPGFLVCVYILIFCIYATLQKKIKINNSFIFIILLFANFCIMIKITNSLIYLYLLILFFIFSLKKINIFNLIIGFIPLTLWIYQNLNISGCLIWPLKILCFLNTDRASTELYLIESFAKGDIATSINLSGFFWIIIWLQNHSYKLMETYIFYIIVLFIPIIYFYFRHSNKIYSNFFSFNYLKTNIIYVCLYFIIFISNLIWFFYTPAYRFGFFYNLNLIIFLILPFWVRTIHININFINKTIKIIFLIAVLFFLFENYTRIDWYFDIYGLTWPPINNGKLIIK